MYVIDLNDIFLSGLRWIIGLSIGSFLGLSFALLTQLRFLRNNFMRYLIDFFRAIPIIGLVPIVQMNIGINEYGKIGIIIWAVTFIIWITVKNSLEKSIPNAELILNAARFDNRLIQKHYVIPKIFSGFIKGIELAIGTAWLCVVASEWVGTYTKGFWAGGLGYKLIVGYELNNWELVYYNLICFGVLGFLSSLIFRLLINVFFKRNKKFRPLLSTIIMDN